MKSRGKLAQQENVVPESAVLTGWKINCIGIDPTFMFPTLVRSAGYLGHPFPNMCPNMARESGEQHHVLFVQAGDTKWHVLTRYSELCELKKQAPPPTTHSEPLRDNLLMFAFRGCGR
jgi:hypothetical protein